MRHDCFSRLKESDEVKPQHNDSTCKDVTYDDSMNKVRSSTE